jgi:phytoene synthase
VSRLCHGSRNGNAAVKRQMKGKSVSTAVEAAFTYCREVTRRQAKNFYYAFLFLPKTQREAIYTVYAFCRYCDDIVDEDHPLSTQRELIQAWRDELGQCYAGQPTHIITKALRHTIERYAIPKEYFDELLYGVEMDLDIQRYATFADLQQYCYRVASVIGLACINIFGYTHPGVQAYARNLGIALQLTNILRDVKEDAARNRIYLPLEDLHTFAYPETDLLQQRYTDAFVALMQFQKQRAVSYYRQAEACLLPGDKASLVAPEIMAGIYQATLRKICRYRYDVFDQRISLPTTYKLLIALRVFVRIWVQHWTLAFRQPSLH